MKRRVLKNLLIPRSIYAQAEDLKEILICRSMIELLGRSLSLFEDYLMRASEGGVLASYQSQIQILEIPPFPEGEVRRRISGDFNTTMASLLENIAKREKVSETYAATQSVQLVQLLRAELQAGGRIGYIDREEFKAVNYALFAYATKNWNQKSRS